jgi:hypothetical protein
MSTATSHANESEVTILTRFLGDGNGQFPKDVACYILDLTISERDKAWQRAKGRCEYCQMPQAADDATFEIDHIAARKHHGLTVATSLYVICYYCNSLKCLDLTSLESRNRRITPPFNPRRHKMVDAISLGRRLPGWLHRNRPRHSRIASHQRQVLRRTP